MKNFLSFLLGLVVYFPIFFLTRTIVQHFFDITNEWLVWLITIPITVVLVGIVAICSKIVKKHKQKSALSIDEIKKELEEKPRLVLSPIKRRMYRKYEKIINEYEKSAAKTDETE